MIESRSGSNSGTTSAAAAGHARRVLFVTYNFPPKLGGLEQVVLEVWRALGERSEVVTLAQHAPGLPSHDGDVYRAGGDGLARFFAFLLRTGSRLVREGRFDVVVAGSALVAMPVALLARAARAGSVAITYGLDSIYPSLIYQGIYRISMPRLDRVIAISHATRNEAVARGVAPQRIEILHPGCHGGRFARPRDALQLRQRWGLEGARVILSAGRLVKRKGVDRFVRECLPSVVARVPEAKLLLAGGNPEDALAHSEDMAGLVREAAQQVGIAKHIVFTGRLDDDEMVGAFQLADVFVLPAVPSPGDMEGFGIVLLEAAASGTPSVATRTGGIPDAVVDGETGTLVPSLDYGAMADALVAFLTDDHLRERVASKARERVMRDFLWEKVAPRYADAVLRF